jgi:hypothetical protein
MDICTFVTGTALAFGLHTDDLIMVLPCYSPKACEVSADGRQYCVGGEQIACPAPPPVPAHFDCERPDHTHYWLSSDKKQIATPP